MSAPAMAGSLDCMDAHRIPTAVLSAKFRRSDPLAHHLPHRAKRQNHRVIGGPDKRSVGPRRGRHSGADANQAVLRDGTQVIRTRLIGHDTVSSLAFLKMEGSRLLNPQLGSAIRTVPLARSWPARDRMAR